MGTYVDGKGTALDEALIAISPSAYVGSVVGMNPIVSDEIGLAIERLREGGKRHQPLRG